MHCTSNYPRQINTYNARRHILLKRWKMCLRHSLVPPVPCLLIAFCIWWHVWQKILSVTLAGIQLQCCVKFCTRLWILIVNPEMDKGAHLSPFTSSLLSPPNIVLIKILESFMVNREQIQNTKNEYFQKIFFSLKSLYFFLIKNILIFYFFILFLVHWLYDRNPEQRLFRSKSIQKQIQINCTAWSIYIYVSMCEVYFFFMFLFVTATEDFLLSTSFL